MAYKVIASSQGLEQAVEQTRQELKKEPVVLFDAALKSGMQLHFRSNEAQLALLT